MVRGAPDSMVSVPWFVKAPATVSSLLRVKVALFVKVPPTFILSLLFQLPDSIFRL